MNSNPSSGQRVLNSVRWFLCLTGFFMAVGVTPETLGNYRKWHLALASDPSAADFWRTNFYLDLGRIAIEVALVVAIFLILKPRTKNSNGPEQAT